MTNKLTTKTYWEQYYKHSHADAKHIVKVCSYYDKFWSKLFEGNNTNKTLIEIGGFPGRYLAYLSHTHKVIPTCLDYNSDQSQIEETFKVMKIKQYHIIQADFTTYKPMQAYDYVISNGFVEHFNNFDNILDLHVNYLNETGKLLIMIPNMTGYIKFYKWLVDWENLKMHNLKCMSLDIFQKFAAKHGLQIKELTYFGDFPHSVHQRLNVLQKIIFKVHQIFFKNFANHYVNKYPSQYFSSGIIAIFEKSQK